MNRWPLWLERSPANGGTLSPVPCLVGSAAALGRQVRQDETVADSRQVPARQPPIQPRPDEMFRAALPIFAPDGMAMIITRAGVGHFSGAWVTTAVVADPSAGSARTRGARSHPHRHPEHRFPANSPQLWYRRRPRPPTLSGMAEFRMRYSALFTSRRVRASARVSVSLMIGSPKPAMRSGIQRHCPTAEVDDHPELRARWCALPKPIRPEEWVTETGNTHVPGSLLIAEAERHPEGFYPYHSS